MKISHRFTKLSGPDRHLTHGQPRSPFQIIFQRMSRNIIHNRKNLSGHLQKIIDPRKISMMKILQDISLSPEIQPSRGAVRDLFHRNRFSEPQVHGLIHDAASALSDHA